MLSAVRLIRQDLNPQVAVGDLLRDLKRIVGRPVVDDENAKTLDGLRQNAVDALRQEPAVLVAGNDDVDAAHEMILT